ncbi:hypothetical protein SprV_0200809500 [Sparganum proliferum]
MTWRSRQSSCFYKANTMERRIALNAPKSSAPEVLSQDVLHVRRDNLRTGEGHTNGFADFGFIAEAVLQQLESLVSQHHRAKLWARYVDGTFVVIDLDQLLTFKEHLNAVFPDIQFTMEEEENNQLTFLDVLAYRKDFAGLKTKVFRKATNTMQILDFNSNHPISHKRSCVRTLYRRVKTHAVSRKTGLPDYNTSDGSSKPMATRATSSTGAYAKGTKGLTARTPNLGGRFRMSKTFRKLSAAFSHHLGLQLHTDRRQPSGVWS